MDGRERDLFLTQAKRDHQGRNCLADLRMTLKIFAWFEPATRTRDPNSYTGEEISIESRMKCWTADFSRISGLLKPDQDMANFFSAELERGRIARPPFTPYIIPDSLASYPWLPADDPHRMALERWKANQATYNRYTGTQDLAVGPFSLYRMRFILSGDIADDWSSFGGICAQINHLGVVIGLPITDHAGIALTYDSRAQRMLQKAAKMRSTDTDYFALLSSLNRQVYEAVLKEFESHSDVIKREKEKEKAAREKEKNAAKRISEKGAAKKGADANRDGRRNRRLGERGLGRVACEKRYEPECEGRGDECGAGGEEGSF